MVPGEWRTENLRSKSGQFSAVTLGNLVCSRRVRCYRLEPKDYAGREFRCRSPLGGRGDHHDRLAERGLDRAREDARAAVPDPRGLRADLDRPAGAPGHDPARPDALPLDADALGDQTVSAH